MGKSWPKYVLKGPDLIFPAINGRPSTDFSRSQIRTHINIAIIICNGGSEHWCFVRVGNSYSTACLLLLFQNNIIFMQIFVCFVFFAVFMYQMLEVLTIFWNLSSLNRKIRILKTNMEVFLTNSLGFCDD